MRHCLMIIGSWRIRLLPRVCISRGRGRRGRWKRIRRNRGRMGLGQRNSRLFSISVATVATELDSTMVIWIRAWEYGVYDSVPMGGNSSQVHQTNVSTVPSKPPPPKRMFITVYDVEMRKISLRLLGHQDDINAVCFADPLSTNVLFSGSDDSFVKVWDRRSMAGGGEAGCLAGHMEGITFVSSKGDGRY